MWWFMLWCQTLVKIKTHVLHYTLSHIYTLQKLHIEHITKYFSLKIWFLSIKFRGFSILKSPFLVDFSSPRVGARMKVQVSTPSLGERPGEILSKAFLRFKKLYLKQLNQFYKVIRAVIFKDFKGFSKCSCKVIWVLVDWCWKLGFVGTLGLVILFFL